MDEHHALTWALYLLGSDALQVAFRHMVRIRKPTQDAATLVRRFTWALEAPRCWFRMVYGYIDQCDFRVPLHHRVRPGCQGGRGDAPRGGDVKPKEASRFDGRGKGHKGAAAPTHLTLIVARKTKSRSMAHENTSSA